MESKELALILVKYLLNKYEGDGEESVHSGLSSTTSVFGQKSYTEEEKELVASFDAFVKGEDKLNKGIPKTEERRKSESDILDTIRTKATAQQESHTSASTFRVSPSELSKSSAPSFQVKQEPDTKPRLEQFDTKPKPRLNFPPTSEGAEEFPGAFDDFDFDNL